MTDPHAIISYASMVTRVSVWVVINIATLNMFRLLWWRFELCWVLKFSRDSDKTVLNLRALFGLKSANAAFRSYLSHAGPIQLYGWELWLDLKRGSCTHCMSYFICMTYVFIIIWTWSWNDCTHIPSLNLEPKYVSRGPSWE